MFVNQTDKNPKLRHCFSNMISARRCLWRWTGTKSMTLCFSARASHGRPARSQADKFYNKQLATQYTRAMWIRRIRFWTARPGQARRRRLPHCCRMAAKLFLTADVMVSDPASIDTLELIKKQWAEIGIDLGIKTEERSLFYDRARTTITTST